MTPEQITLVKESWEKVKPISEQAAELFYGRLFELNPDLQSLFSGDMEEQGKKLMTTITLAVTSLDRLDAILPALQSLGKKHSAEYEVPDSSYATVGEALIWTLDKGLGEAFTDDVKKAWLLTYATLSEAMLSGTESAA
ncbi:globin family protein [Neorhodopirellula lusitana]|uniref:globin family protein n=1 Tax=Neorhodopirellula lusitana TaxID=445327 RepID=UPI00384D7C96